MLYNKRGPNRDEISPLTSEDNLYCDGFPDYLTHQINMKKHNNDCFWYAMSYLLFGCDSYVHTIKGETLN